MDVIISGNIIYSAKFFDNIDLQFSKLLVKTNIGAQFALAFFEMVMMYLGESYSELSSKFFSTQPITISNLHGNNY